MALPLRALLLALVVGHAAAATLAAQDPAPPRPDTVPRTPRAEAPHDTALDGRQRHWYAGFHAGAGYLTRSSAESPENAGTQFAMAFAGGINLTPQWRLGIEVGGFLLHTSSDMGPIYSVGPDTSGAGVMQLFAVTQWYPQLAHNWFLRAGAGEAEYWDQRPGHFGSVGVGYTVGLGYDWTRAGSEVALSALLAYNWGTLGDARTAAMTSTNRRYRAIELRMGFIIH